MAQTKATHYLLVHDKNYRGGVNNLQVARIAPIGDIRASVKTFTSLHNRAEQYARRWARKQGIVLAGDPPPAEQEESKEEQVLIRLKKRQHQLKEELDVSRQTELMLTLRLAEQKFGVKPGSRVKGCNGEYDVTRIKWAANPVPVLYGVLIQPDGQKGAEQLIGMSWELVEDEDDPAIDDNSEDVDRVDPEKMKLDVCLAWNNASVWGSCAFCDAPVHPPIGMTFFEAGTHRPVCETCAKERHPSVYWMGQLHDALLSGAKPLEGANVWDALAHLANVLANEMAIWR